MLQCGGGGASLGPPVTKRYTRLLPVAVVWLAFVGWLSLRAHTIVEPTEPKFSDNGGRGRSTAAHL
jgi:hypothetical protein